MTTHAYEMLDGPPAVIAAEIRADALAASLLNMDGLSAMLGWAQHEQDRIVYERCYDEFHGRNAWSPPAMSDARVVKLMDESCRIRALSDDPELDCRAHGFTYKTGSAGCPVCVLGEPEDLTAGTTAVRIHLLSCGHVVWVAHPVSEPATINHCLSCNAEAAVEHYLDEQVIDA